VNIYMALLGKV